MATSSNRCRDIGLDFPSAIISPERGLTFPEAGIASAKFRIVRDAGAIRTFLYLSSGFAVGAAQRRQILTTLIASKT
jgi:hypothetical protein